MPSVSDADVERVRGFVTAIPAGKVATYGDLAELAGLSNPRVVGWIMRTDSADLPWHRVIGVAGTPAPHLRGRQLEELRAEGVPIAGGKVTMRVARIGLADLKARAARA